MKVRQTFYPWVAKVNMFRTYFFTRVFLVYKSVCAQQRDFSLPLEEAHQDFYFLHVLCMWGLIKLSLNGAFVF